MNCGQSLCMPSFNMNSARLARSIFFVLLAIISFTQISFIIGRSVRLATLPKCRMFTPYMWKYMESYSDPIGLMSMVSKSLTSLFTDSFLSFNPAAASSKSFCFQKVKKNIKVLALSIDWLSKAKQLAAASGLHLNWWVTFHSRKRHSKGRNWSYKDTQVAVYTWRSKPAV